MLRQNYKPVATPFGRAAAKFIHISAALIPKVPEHLKGRVLCQAVYVQHTRFLNKPAGIVLLVHANGDKQWRTCDLHDAIDDAAVILIAVPCGEDIQPISYLIKSLRVKYRRAHINLFLSRPGAGH